MQIRRARRFCKSRLQFLLFCRCFFYLNLYLLFFIIISIVLRFERPRQLKQQQNSRETTQSCRACRASRGAHPSTEQSREVGDSTPHPHGGLIALTQTAEGAVTPGQRCRCSGNFFFLFIAHFGRKNRSVSGLLLLYFYCTECSIAISKSRNSLNGNDVTFHRFFFFRLKLSGMNPLCGGGKGTI